jgi:hypothetical protein
MIKLFLSVTTLLSLAVFVNAQNSSPYWSLSGNSNATSTSKLGTTNGINLRLFTNNLERARITTSGLFGIGTTNPVTKLHVNGFGSFGNQITTLNATRALNLADANAVIRVLRVHQTYAPAVELISRTSADGPNVAYWDAYAEPGDASFRIRDRQSGNQDRLTIQHTTGNVGIGTTTPSSKLHVVGGIDNPAITGEGYAYGVYGSSGYTGVFGIGFSNQSIGVEGEGATGMFGKGVSNDDQDGIGVRGEGFAGVRGEGRSEGGNVSYGVIGTSDGRYGYGGYFTSVDGTGLHASTNSDLSYAAEFIGDVNVTGQLYQTSDKNLKKNIQELANAMSIINKLKPKNYEFRNEDKYASLHLAKGNHYGLIAQELEEVLPNLVKESRHELESSKALSVKPTATGKPATVKQEKEAKETINIKAVNYVELIPIIIKGMQEQEATIQKQNAKIEELTQLVNKLSLNTNTSGSVKLAGASLGQSTPNPNSASARISYTIPTGFLKAELIINNEGGQKVKQVQLNKRGLVDIDTSRLSAGAYFYTLYVNGAPVDTKKMVVVRD